MINIASKVRGGQPAVLDGGKELQFGVRSQGDF